MRRRTVELFAEFFPQRLRAVPLPARCRDGCGRPRRGRGAGCTRARCGCQDRRRPSNGATAQRRNGTLPIVAPALLAEQRRCPGRTGRCRADLGRENPGEGADPVRPRTCSRRVPRRSARPPTAMGRGRAPQHRRELARAQHRTRRPSRAASTKNGPGEPVLPRIRCARTRPFGPDASPAPRHAGHRNAPGSRRPTRTSHGQAPDRAARRARRKLKPTGSSGRGRRALGSGRRGARRVPSPRHQGCRRQ